MNLSIKNLKRTEFLEAISIIIIGLLFAIFPGFWAEFFSIIFAVIIIVVGVIMVFNCFLEKKYTSFHICKFICGLIFFGWGIFLIFNLSVPISLLAIIIGIIAIIIATVRLTDGISLKKHNEKYLFSLIDGVINALFGLFMLINPFTGINIMIMILGFYLIYAGVFFMIIVKNSKFTLNQ